MSRGRRAGLAVVVVLAVAGIPTVAGARNDDDAGKKDRVELTVGLHDGDRCRPDGDELPTMVSEAALQPGDSTAPVTVCARSKGGADTRLSLAVTEVTETDLACTGDEAAVDTTCGGGQPGELADQLVVSVATQPKCKGRYGPARTLDFSELATTATVVAPVMKHNQVDCITLAIAYPSPSAEAAALAQSDRVRWRYAFDLSS